MTHKRLLATLGLCALGACLEPPDEMVSYGVMFGDPAQAPDISELPDYALRESDFTQQADYLRGFAEGRPIWFWNVDGLNSDLIAPSFHILDDQRQSLQQVVIDVIPGDAGYTPWWRVVEYVVTDLYDGQTFTSREAVAAAAQAGLLDGPYVTDTVINAPVSVRKVAVNDGRRIRTNTATVWYRGFRAHWLPFERNLTVATSSRTMPVEPVYILQRIDEPFPLYELGAGFDLTGDDQLDDSNNIFAFDVSNPKYTPLWRPVIVRTSTSYVSIDTEAASRNVDFTSERQVYDRAAGRKTPAVLSVHMESDILLNCPIQTSEGNVP